MKHTLIVFTCFTLLLLINFNEAYSQDDTVSTIQYEALSLEDLLSIKVVSASKTNELLFDAPLSASVLTKEEIQKAGSTSIMEALRLIPGLIVREQTNGNYDIHIRGMDNIPPNAAFDIASTTILVMIDSRPIYSYLRGGTFWETLPVDLNDVEKIEVIRGPAAALYGPNAVNGVINIITREIKNSGLYLVANSKQGSYGTDINNVSAGYKFKKWSFIASANYQRRERSQTSYFEFARDKWLQDPDYFISFSGDTSSNISDRYPHPELAMEKYAGNLFLTYKPSQKVKLDLSSGIQQSLVQKVSVENTNTPLSTAASKSRYVNLRANIKDISAQVSYNKGTQTVDYDPGNKYDFSTFDATVEYSFTRGPLILRPGLSYRNAIYDDTRYLDVLHKASIFNNSEGSISTREASLRGEYKLLNNKLRLIAGLTATKFNYPDSTYLSYEFAATYSINKRHMVRAVYSQAPRSSSVFDTYVNQTIAYFPTGRNHFTRLALFGNKSLKLFTANMLEIGYRASFASNFHLDVELFNTRAGNSYILAEGASYTEINGKDTVQVSPITAINLPLKLIQKGITLSVSYSSKMFQLKPFITVQKTKILDYAPYNNTVDLGQGTGNIYSGVGTTMTNKSTPSAYGGAVANFIPGHKFNINMSAYYYARQTYTHISNIMFNDGVRGIDHIDARLILNASVSYKIIKEFQFFCTAKNLLNNRSREFFKTDETPFMLLGGMYIDFNKNLFNKKHL